MQSTRHGWLSAAQGADWFRLNRHDDPEPTDPPESDPAPEGDPDPEPEGDRDPEGADKLGDAGKKALDKMKAERAAAKKAAAEEKKRADELARKVAEFEDRDKSELEKVTGRAEAAAKRAEVATARAVRAEVKAAAAEFADPEDAAAFLDLSRYADDSGDIDTEAIQSDLADLLERKPHLKRQPPGPEMKPGPKPDPSQGVRKDPPPADYRNASRDELSKKLAEFGVRLRR
ncbi:hypothetical protein ACL02U_12075 [Streptomyces sp. MS06]|uniref:hypothetical protein n=1 Tax=Streptomyces sp. MS06 TaxID=3385974 RepID=UPI0039A3D81B